MASLHGAFWKPSTRGHLYRLSSTASDEVGSFERLQSKGEPSNAFLLALPMPRSLRWFEARSFGPINGAAERRVRMHTVHVLEDCKPDMRTLCFEQVLINTPPRLKSSYKEYNSNSGISCCCCCCCSCFVLVSFVVWLIDCNVVGGRCSFVFVVVVVFVIAGVRSCWCS